MVSAQQMPKISVIRSLIRILGLCVPLLFLACSGERYTGLMNAARGGDIAAVRHMLDLGAEPNQKTSLGKTAIMLAAAGGYTDIVKLLADRGADVGARDAYGTTAIIAAATAGHAKTTAMLLDYGADPTFKDSSGGSALSNATLFGQKDVVLTILDKKTDLPKDVTEELLLLAAGLGHKDITLALLKYGTNIDAHGVKNRTPLMAAIAFNKAEIVKLLIDHGADTNAKDSDGNSVLQLAQNKGNYQIIKLLQSTKPPSDKKP